MTGRLIILMEGMVVSSSSSFSFAATIGTGGAVETLGAIVGAVVVLLLL